MRPPLNGQGKTLAAICRRASVLQKIADDMLNCKLVRQPAVLELQYTKKPVSTHNFRFHFSESFS
jgi:hypothetical protein